MNSYFILIKQTDDRWTVDEIKDFSEVRTKYGHLFKLTPEVFAEHVRIINGHDRTESIAAAYCTGDRFKEGIE